MSVALGEKSPSVTFASLESHKIGGIVRLPREIDEQSIVLMGQFLARYGAVEFARAEDTWGFLADGGVNYESVRGVVQIARDTSKTVALATTKTKPSDAVLDDFRLLRSFTPCSVHKGSRLMSAKPITATAIFQTRSGWYCGDSLHPSFPFSGHRWSMPRDDGLS